MSIFTSLRTLNINKIIRPAPAKNSPMIEMTHGASLGVGLLSLRYKMHTWELSSVTAEFKRKYASQKSPNVIARKITAKVFNAITIVCKIDLV